MSPRIGMMAARIAASLLACGLVAQGREDRLRELERAQQELQRLRADAEALLEARVHIDLGLAADLAALPLRLSGSVDATAPAMERARFQLSQEEAVTADLLTRYERVRKDAEALRRDAEVRAAGAQQKEEWVVVRSDAAATSPLQDQGRHRPVAAAPAGESRPIAPTPVRVVASLDPIRAQIDGATDRLLVARALGRAAQALMDRAEPLRAAGQDEAADQALEAAQQRLLRAIEELNAAEAGAEPSFAKLFQLGRCREQLFRVDERRGALSLQADARDYQRREQEVRDAYLAITVRDVVVHGRDEDLGPWGRAAQAALDHFRWMNLHAGYQPKAAPEAIEWPGSK